MNNKITYHREGDYFIPDFEIMLFYNLYLFKNYKSGTSNVASLIFFDSS